MEESLTPEHVRFLGICPLYPLCIVSSWVMNGDMPGYLKDHPEVNRLWLSIDIARGLAYMHSIGVINGDLKGANILINDAGRACLADFGLSTILYTTGTLRSITAASSARGSVRWMAPELLNPDPNKLDSCLPTVCSDVFALAMVLWELYTGEVPLSGFRNDLAVALQVVKGMRPQRPDGPGGVFPAELWNLMEICWQERRELRPSAAAALASLESLLVEPDAFSFETFQDCDGGGVPASDARKPNTEGDETEDLADYWSPEVDADTSGTGFATHVHTPASSEAESGKLSPIPARSSSSSPPPPLTPPSWVRGTLIAKGTYGRIYLAMRTKDGILMAVKQIESPAHISEDSDPRDRRLLEAIQAEARIMTNLRHRHILEYLGCEQTATFYSIFLEYVPGESLGACLRVYGRFNENVTKSFTRQILSGLQYLHSEEIIHRDIKADNVWVDHTGVCKITEFGSAERIDTIIDEEFVGMVGSIFWMAPEIVRGKDKTIYTTKVDIWSTGCVLLEMWSGKRPWANDDAIAAMFKMYRETPGPDVPSNVVLTVSAEDFRSLCFHPEPQERPPASGLLQHPYLQLPPGWKFNPGFV